MKLSQLIIALAVAANPLLLVSGQEYPILRDPGLLTKPSSNLILTLNNPLGPVLAGIGSTEYPDRESRLQAIQDGLRSATASWQAPVIEGLRSYEGVEVTPYWITNKIYVKNANPEVVTYLRTLTNLGEIAEELLIPLPPIFNPVIGRPPNGSEWGVKLIGAEDVWNATNGNGGEGVVVAVIDTGVRWSHTALRANMVPRNSWYDAVWRWPFPTDSVGHGTHCAGVICGNNGIGVAPNANWMACRACDLLGCPENALLTCGQWIICPTDGFGFNANCSLSPHIVSNSWGGGGNQTFYNDVIDAWNTAGIIGFFAAGNAGPDCGTAGSPGDQAGVISVGSTNINDTVSTYSSRGPKIVSDGMTVPLIVAPGEAINSAFHLTDNAYQVMSGTSMATPHMAGAAALLVSNNPELTREQLEGYFYPTTERDLGPTGSMCGNNAEDVYPNDVAGYGRVDVSAAFASMTSG